MANSLNSVFGLRAVSAMSMLNNIKKRNVINDSDVAVKSLFMQVQAMAELDRSDPVGKTLNIII